MGVKIKFEEVNDSPQPKKRLPCLITNLIESSTQALAQVASSLFLNSIFYCINCTKNMPPFSGYRIRCN